MSDTIATTGNDLAVPDPHGEVLHTLVRKVEPLSPNSDLMRVWWDCVCGSQTVNIPVAGHYNPETDEHHSLIEVQCLDSQEVLFQGSIDAIGYELHEL